MTYITVTSEVSVNVAMSLQTGKKFAGSQLHCMCDKFPQIVVALTCRVSDSVVLSPLCAEFSSLTI